MWGITCPTCSLGTTIARGVLVFPLHIPRLINDILGPEVKCLFVRLCLSACLLAVFKKCYYYLNSENYCQSTMPNWFWA